MGLFSADFYCQVCDHYWEDLIPRDARNEPYPCPLCGTEWKRLFGAPNVMNRALPDGTKRDATFQRAKMYAELECAHAEADSEDERKEIKKEMSNIRKRGASV